MKPEEARELLPSYAAGALSAEQSKRVEALLRVDPGLTQELAEWRALQTVVAEVGTDEPAFRPELIDDAHRRIEAYEEGRRASLLKRQPRQDPITRARAGTLRTWLTQIVGLWDATPFVARVAVAAQFAILAVLVTTLSMGRPDEAGFTTASGSVGGVADGRSVSVMFQPETTFSEVQGLLELTGAQIVAGPSGQGIFLLNMGDIDDAEVARLLEMLRSNNAVVRFAAPVE